MSSVSIRDAQAAADRRWIEASYREFLGDLAPQATGLYPALTEFGHSETDQVMRWVADPQATLLIIAHGSEPAGFALVRTTPPRAADRNVQFRMAEFFIARPWRRRGVGRQAVRLILDRFAGRWEINEDLRNTAAVAFWRRVVAAYTQGSYQERISNGEVHQRFESGAQRRR